MAVAVSRWPRRRVAAQVRPHIAACVLGRPHTPAPPRHPSAPPAPPPSLTASYPRSPRSPSHLPAQQPAHNPTAPPRERRTIPTMPATQRTAALIFPQSPRARSSWLLLALEERGKGREANKSQHASAYAHCPSSPGAPPRTSRPRGCSVLALSSASTTPAPASCLHS